MEAAYLYIKPRAEFGKDVRACLREAPPQLLAHLPGMEPGEAAALLARAYVRREPRHAEVDNTPRMSEHEVNTARCVLKSSSMCHAEGGWPKDVDPTEQADVTRFRKKVEKDEEYKAAVKALGPLLARELKQNNTMDIYEEYFASDSGGGGASSGFGGEDGTAAPSSIVAGGGATATTASTSSGSSLGGRAGGPASPPRGAGGSHRFAPSSSGSAASTAAASFASAAATDPPSAKGLAVFRDPCPVKRAATMLNWHPEGHGKLAVAYSLLNFQDPHFLSSTSSSSSTTGTSTSTTSNRTSSRCSPSSSFIWDMHTPNNPDLELLPPSPLCSLRYNPKSTDTLVGGCYNGLVCLFDLRKPGALVSSTPAAPTPAPVVNTYGYGYSYGYGQPPNWPSCLPLDASLIERSHHDPVYDVHWVSSKTGNQCVSASTDGQLLWWDTRRLSEPTDVLLLMAPTTTATPVVAARPATAALLTTTTTVQQQPLLLGASALEYSVEAGPTKYVVGTEQGVVLGVNLRNRKQNNGVAGYDGGAGHRHHGPIYSLQRNLFHNKFFLTVGDWSAKLWAEDLKTPVLTTRYHPAYLTRGCWSPTRPGVFFLARADGVVDVWDLYYRGATEAAYSHKVGDEALTAIAVQGGGAEPLLGEGAGVGGRLLGVGDAQGTVALLELCGGLAECQPGEKQAVGLMLEREAKQERNLEMRERELRRARASAAAAAVAEAKGPGVGVGGGVDMVVGGGGKDEKMEELLRKVDQDFLAMIKEAEDDEPVRAGAASVSAGDGGGGGSGSGREEKEYQYY